MLASTSLIHLIFHSVASGPAVHEVLEDLAEHARTWNRRAGITGILLHDAGSFMQVVEGPEDAVDELMERIQEDPRHKQLTVIIREPIIRRSFAGWSVGMAHLDGVAWLDQGDAPARLQDLDAGRARKLLEAFAQGRWRSHLVTEFASDLDGPIEPHDVPTTPSVVVWPAFSYAFQPIVDVLSRSVVGYEAFVRGPRNELASAVIGQMHNGAVREFDRTARPLAIGLAAALKLPARLHLNVMPDTLDVEEVTALLHEARTAGIEADQIVLEVTERAAYVDLDDFVTRANGCRRLGVRFAVDHFGNGHSGLSLLADFQPDMLKLDGKLVRGIATHGPRQAIVRAVLHACEDLGIDVVAVGVETLAEYRWLRHEGLGLFQGHLFARPGFETLPEPTFPD